MIKKVKKLWGEEHWLVNTELYCAKFLILKKGYQCSLHIHMKKDETFYVLKGKILLEHGNPNYPRSILHEFIIKKGDQINILPFYPHRFRALSKTAKILEISTHHEDCDSYRMEESRKI